MESRNKNWICIENQVRRQAHVQTHAHHMHAPHTHTHMHARMHISMHTPAHTDTHLPFIVLYGVYDLTKTKQYKPLALNLSGSKDRYISREYVIIFFFT